MARRCLTFASRTPAAPERPAGARHYIAIDGFEFAAAWSSRLCCSRARGRAAGWRAAGRRCESRGDEEAIENAGPLD